MTEFKSFDNQKQKIEKTWNTTDKNLSDESKLTKQQVSSFQNNFNRAITIIPLISHQEATYEITRPHFPEELLEVTLKDIPESFLSFIKVYKKLYRENIDDGFLQFELYTFSNLSWKYVNRNVYIFQLYLPFQSFNNRTFRDVNLIIPNPNIYTSLPKQKI